ncbi:MAG TPA: carboxylating nicotinate-nucleotide diphosphorylase [Bdellovibrionota bacterium]|jgi:nicotinate-nucleotide pyrophosphorylase (carboxylating)
MQNHYAARQLIRLALDEDIGTGDLTVLAVPPEVRARAKLIAKEDCVVSGLELAPLVLEVFGADAQVELDAQNGQKITKGTTLVRFDGRARDLLTCERTILNFLQRLCGIATQAARYKDALGSSKVTVLDTRKTTPGLRELEKQAVKDGGLSNHRMRLDEGVLVKENHIRASGSIKLALANLHGKVKPGIPVEVEVTRWEEAQEALDCGVSRLLVDNFTPQALRDLIPRIRAVAPKTFIEASGGITLSNLTDFTATGVDAVSVGALTHSVRAIDLSLLFEFS